MKKIILYILFLFASVSVNIQAQEYRYYYNDERIELALDMKYIHIIVDGPFAHPFLTDNFHIHHYGNNAEIVKLEFITYPNYSDYHRSIDILRQHNHIKCVLPFFVREANDPIGTSDIFYVRLRDHNDSTTLKKKSHETGVQIMEQVQHMPLWYILSIRNSAFRNSIDASNYFFETGEFAAIDPAFMFNFKPNTDCDPPNDPDFYRLWGLKNNNYQGYDIDVACAWEVGDGAEGEDVIVAVIDQPVDVNHNDLRSNIHSFYDTQNGQSTYPISWLSHGTHVAGTIAAVKNNNLQVVGVAPKSKIMSISHDLYVNPRISAQLADGISYAWQNGASVINNSWGDQGGGLYNQLQSFILEEAIANAMNLGRGGKGCVVVFAAGNYGSHGPIMDYPATFHDDILTVGAIANDGYRADYSGFGMHLDIVAPGSDIYSTIPNNRAGYMSGTSMAAPHVSGIAALVLSINSELTGRQVRDIIESTAKKIHATPQGSYQYSTTYMRPNGTWALEMGYGLADAYEAAYYTDCNDYSTTVGGTLAQSVTWHVNSLATNDIIIPSGITLTITSKIRCEDHVAIIVKTGGKLVLDGANAELTNTCGENVWRGVIVYGNRNLSQTDAQQGSVVLMNGATISNAECGITVWDNINYTTSGGGIITATNANFINNRRALDFAPYIRIANGVQINNRSKFEHCNFLVNQRFGDHSAGFLSQVRLREVIGINFAGCHFKNTFTGYNCSLYLCTNAIEALSAGFSLDCGWSGMYPFPGTPCPENRRSSIDGFWHGILSRGYYGTRSISIGSTDFKNNFSGGDISDSYATILRNRFDVGKADFIPIYHPRGFELYRVLTFRIEENIFNKDYLDYTFGISVSQCGGANNLVYKNQFYNLHKAQSFSGLNRSVTDPFSGVKSLCNIHEGNINHDIQIYCTDVTHGMSSYQTGSTSIGVNMLPAGNLFSQSATMHIESNAQHFFSYFYSTNSSLEFPQRRSQIVSPTLVYTSNTCPSRIGVTIRPDLEYATINTQAQELLYNYQQLIDGGNTEMLLVDIQSSWSSDIWELRDELIKKSPYLSQEVLREIVEQNLLPQAVFLEIALRNVDATKDYSFLDFLKEKGFPVYMISIIETNWTVKSLRTLLEEQLSVYTTERDYLLNLMLEQHFEDSVDYSSIRNLLLSRKYYSDYLIIAETYLEENDFANAYNAISQMEQDYPKNKHVKEEAVSYHSYISILEEYHKAEKTIYELTENDINELQNFSMSALGRANHLAHNILCMVYNICLEERETIPEKSSKLSLPNLEQNSDNNLSHVRVMPNPAQLYTTFEWDFDSFIYDAILVIYDASGKPLVRHPIHAPKGQWVWNTSKTPNGTYIYAIMDGAHVAESGKVIIQK